MECGTVRLLSQGETIMGIKHDRVMAETFAEGTVAVGSLGFIGFIIHMCANRYVTTPLFNISS